MQAQQTLKSRLYHLQTRNGEETWVEKCQGYPVFRKQDNIFKLKFYTLPNRQLFYEIIVNSNIDFTQSENGIEWTQIKENEVMGISFKQDYSAHAFWELIEDYRKNYAVTVSAANGIIFYFEYRVPDPTVDNIEEVYNQLENIPQIERHQRVASIFLTKRELLPKLMAVFKTLDAERRIPQLETVFKIMRILFNSSNEEMLYELMSTDYYMFVLGALEYDPNFRNCRTEHRQFMKNQAKLLEVVPFKNPDMLSLIVFTYRLQYVKQCILSPYLSDSAIITTTVIVKNNYRKILSHIFNPKKKDFINHLFDLLRAQELLAYKLLREIFRIAKSINTEQIYLYIAQRDFFEIMIRNMKEERNTDQNPPGNKKTKKKTIQVLSEIVGICMQILQQFMEGEPLHFKAYCVSQTEEVSNYPTLEFLLERFEGSPHSTGQKMAKILSQLVGCEDNHPIKSISHEKILNKFMHASTLDHLRKWAPIFSKIIKPHNPLINQKKYELISKLTQALGRGPKTSQIQVLIALRDLINTYITQEKEVQEISLSEDIKIARFLSKNNGNIGIRQSILFSMFSSKLYHPLAQRINDRLKEILQSNVLVKKYIDAFQIIMSRKQIELPTTLKRERSQKLLDEESYEKIQKKIKPDN